MAAQLEGVARQILGIDNDLRRQAEQTYYAMRDADPNAFIAAHVEVFADAARNSSARLFCGEMLRQHMLPTSQVWRALTPEVRALIRDSLAQMFQGEASPVMRRKVLFAVAALSHRLATSPDAGITWPELLPTTLHGCTASDVSPAMRQSCYELLLRIADASSGILLADVDGVRSAIVAGMAEGNALPIRTTALGVAAAMITAAARARLHDPDSADQIEAAVSAAFGGIVVEGACTVLTSALNAGDDDAIAAALTSLRDISRADPVTYFAPLLPAVIALFTQIALTDAELEGDVRRSAAYALLSLGDGKGKEMVRALPAYGEAVLNIAFTWLVEIDFTEEWANDPASDDEEINPNHHVGQFLLSQLPGTLGGVTMCKTILAQCLGMAQSPPAEWQTQVAGALGLLTLAEKAWKPLSKQGAAYLQVAPATLRLLQPDCHPRVRWTAMALASKLADESPKFVNSNVSALMTAFIALMNANEQCVRVCTSACTYFVGVLSAIKSDNLVPYQEHLFTMLTGMLGHAHPDVRMAALSAISGTAVASHEHIAPYYPGLMEGMLGLAETTINSLAAAAAAGAGDDGSVGVELLTLRHLAGKASECIGFVAHAAGKELFLQHAERAVALVARVQATEAALPDASHDLSARAIEAMTKVLDDDFAPFLPYVFDSFLSAATEDRVFARFPLDADGRVLAADVERAAEYSEANGFHLLTMNNSDGSGRSRLAIHSVRLQDKIFACKMITAFANNLKDAFGPYVERAVCAVVPLCLFRFHPQVRSQAYAAVPALFNAAKAMLARAQHLSSDVANGGAEHAAAWDASALGSLRSLWAQFVPMFVEAASFETLSNHASLALAVSTTIDHLPMRASEAELAQLAAVAQSIIEPNLLDRAEVIYRVEHPDDDDEESYNEGARALEMSNTNIEAVALLCSSIAKNGGAPVAAALEQRIVAQYLPLTTDVTKDAHVLLSGMQVVTSLLLHCNGVAAHLTETLYSLGMTHLCTDDHELRNVAAQAVRACAISMGAAAFAPMLPQVLERLFEALEIGEAHEEDQETCEAATDHVVALTTHILETFALCDAPAIPADATQRLVEAWLAVMPRQADEDACVPVNGYFMRLVAANHPLVVGENNANLTRVLEIMAEALDAENEYDSLVVDAATAEGMRGYWKFVQGQLGEAGAKQVWNALDKQFREALNE